MAVKKTPRPVSAATKAKRKTVPKVDRLDAKQLAAKYGYAMALLKSSKELNALFRQALADPKGQWTPERFMAGVRDSKWYQRHTETWRQTEALRLQDPKTYESNVQDRADEIMMMSVEMGASVSAAEAKQIATNAYRNGLTKKEINDLLYQQFDLTAANLTGTAGAYGDELRALASQNGMTYTDSFYTQAGALIAAGKGTPEEWEDQIRAEAASQFPVFSDRILAGENARDLASGYVNRMAQTFEIDPATVTLQDPHLKAAMGGIGPDGEPVAMGLWDFEKRLRQDSRWMGTMAAQSESAQVADSVLRSFGFLG
jgi:hypothetical protein